ncbi:MAG: hypothetical protein R2755_33130 [Acidimicrobiales bacterium]
MGVDTLRSRRYVGGDAMAWFSGPSAVTPEMVLLGGDDTLEVVGESYHLDNIWRIVGGRPSSTVRRPIRAVLIPETDNPHDANAVAIVIDGLLVGHPPEPTRWRTGLVCCGCTNSTADGRSRLAV